MRKVVIYVRVSTKEQAEEGYSIGAQLEKLRAYCQIKDWSIIEEYIDAGYSGGKLERPAIQKLIKDVKRKKFEMVLVYKLDRLSRSQKDTLYLIEDVFHPNGVKFSSMNENFDTSTPLGMAMVGILSVFAQLERAQITERMQLGLEARSKEGLWSGGGFDPIGYDYIQAKGVKGAGQLVINEYEALQIRKIYDLFESGMSIHQIQTFMHSKYSNKYGSWHSSSSIYNMLENPVVAGMIKTPDGYIEGKHQPIISKERFDKVQDLLADRRRSNKSAQKNPFDRTSLLGGLLFCGNCGARYYIKTINSGRRVESKKLIRYYTCYSRGKSSKKMIIDPNCQNPIMREDNLDQIVIDEICKLQLMPDKVDEIVDAPIDSDQIKLKISDLEKKRKKLIDLFMLDNMPIEEIQTKMNEISNEINALEEQLTVEAQPLISKAEAKEIISDARNIFENGTYDQKVGIIHALIDQIILYEDKLEIHWTFE